MEVMRQKDIFSLMRQGYEALFHLTEEDERYIANRKAEITAEMGSKDGAIVGIHVRHGDCHPWEFEHSKSYIPLDRYMSAVKELFHSKLSSPSSKSTSASPTILLGSDDVQMYTSEPFRSSTIRAQDRALFPSNFFTTTTTTTTTTPPSSSSSSPDDEVKVAGGFFSAIFKTVAASKADKPHGKIREALARSYLLDLKMLAQTSDDGVVCTVSSIGCRLLAVMMGWQDAIVDRKWRNVDGDWDWSGIIW